MGTTERRAEEPRDSNGQYADRDFTKICECGHSLAVHAAANRTHMRACFDCDAPGGTGSDCACENFKKARKKA